VSGVTAAAPILQRNVYGWFDRVTRGTYGLTVAGEQALNRFAHAIAVLDEPIAGLIDEPRPRTTEKQLKAALS
jgi:hypothetical protein